MTAITELPPDFVRRIQPLLGSDWTAFTDALAQPLRRGLRVNTLKTDAAHLRAVFPHALIPTPFAPDTYYLDAPHKAGSDPLHHAGAYYMQEPSATGPAAVLAARPGERILDLCAAPGGKSTQLAAALRGTGLLWCNEYVPARARLLQQNLERCGVRQAVVSSGDTGRLCRALPDFFDGVLVDAPCSGEGLFRKEPQALADWSENTVRLCAARQDMILDNAAGAVRPGGRLVYSTCTFAPEEDELVIARFLLHHPDFALEPIDVPWGMPGFSLPALAAFGAPDACPADLTHCRRILPQHGGEGHFIARLRRADTAPAAVVRPYAPPVSDPHREAAQALYASCFSDEPVGVFVTVGDTVRLLPPGLPALTGTGTLSAGLAVAQVCKNRLEPCHAAFAAAAAADCRQVLALAPEDPRLIAFLHGEELPCTAEKGFCAVTAAGLTVGFGKSAGSRLKNRYPKGLRLL